MSDTPTPSEALLLAESVGQIDSQPRVCAFTFGELHLFRIAESLAAHTIAREAVVKELVAFLDKVIASDQKDASRDMWDTTTKDGPLAKEAREFKRRLEG